jgi:sirohydrochlorin ferrochelatase
MPDHRGQRASSGRPDVLVAVAHGSKDPRAAACVDELMSLVRARLDAGTQVRTAYLGHAAPSLPQVLGSIGPGRRVTVLPLLLTAAYHSKTDLPRMLARSSRTCVCADTLGPHPLLLRALSRRMTQAGVRDRARTGVVLAAAGSSDPEANATISRLAAQWQAADGWHSVMPAYASAASPSVSEAVGEAVGALSRGGARQVAVATYLLAPGFFADRIRREALAAGAVAVSAALGAAPEVAGVILDRYATAKPASRAAA